MVEPTVGGVDRQEELATLHGVNIPLAAYCYELGFAMQGQNEQSEPVTWRDLLSHWRSTLGARQERARNSRHRTYNSYYRANDPMPAFFQAVAASRHLLQEAMNWTGKPSVSDQITNLRHRNF